MRRALCLLMIGCSLLASSAWAKPPRKGKQPPPRRVEQPEEPPQAPPPTEPGEEPKANAPAEEPNDDTSADEPNPAEPPKDEPPKAEPPKDEAPKAEPPKDEAPKAEPPKAEPPKDEPSNAAAPTDPKAEEKPAPESPKPADPAPQEPPREEPAPADPKPEEPEPPPPEEPPPAEKQPPSPPRVGVEKLSFMGGEVPRAATALAGTKARVEKCVVEHGGLAEDGHLELQFLVRTRQRAEGVEVLSRKGVSVAAGRCVQRMLKGWRIGVPSADPVGVGFRYTLTKR